MGTKIRTGLFSALAMVILIIDSRTAFEGATEGLRVCLLQVIPALLPFFVLSILLTSAFSGADVAMLRPIGKLCRMPSGSEGLLLLGLLGGYPSGAQSIAQAYHSGQLDRHDAQRLLGFCSNAGPAFLFGIAASLFPYGWLPWALWLIHILSALLTGVLLPGGCRKNIRMSATKPITLPRAMEKSIGVLAKVCGWLILFRILQAFLEKWLLWLLPLHTQVGIIGVLELANGCLSLSLIGDIGLRAVLCSVFLALGGLCVLMQTISVTAPLNLSHYICGKTIQAAISALFTMILVAVLLPDSEICAVIPLLACLITFFLVVFAVVLRKYEKNSSIPAPVRV